MSCSKRYVNNMQRLPFVQRSWHWRPVDCLVCIIIRTCFSIPSQDEASGEQRRVRVDQFPVASELVNQLMKIIMDEIRAVPVLRTKLFQANFHTTLSGQSMVTLIYHRKLDEEWENEAKRLREKLALAPND